ncbi:hypothetical protein EDD11_003778 [Mortierella claussenii]|nr:hypothetical protein EDD11_003778 [Mortierella claussenii]
MSFLVFRIRPQIQISLRRAFASVPPPDPVSSSSPLTEAQRQSTNKGAQSEDGWKGTSQPPPGTKSDADVNPLMLFLRNHKKHRLAIGAALLIAAGAEGTLYLTIYRKRKEAEASEGSYLISEEGVSPVVK